MTTNNLPAGNTSWEQQAVLLHRTGLFSWREIAVKLDKPKSTVSDYLRGYQGALADDTEVVDNSPKTHDNSRILFISDLHVPYHHEKALVFLDGLKTRYEPTRIICLGDETDGHALSFHDSDPDLMSAGDELRATLPVIRELERMFPVMDLIDSNHGSMVYRKAKHHGVPRHYIRSYNEVLGVGPDWVWHNDLVLDMSEWDVPDVYVHHGKTKKAIATSKAMAMSHVSGHFHESFGVEFWSNPKGLYFGMNSGCLIDNNKMAFSYNKVFPHKPIIGTSLIIEGTPVLEAMKL